MKRTKANLEPFIYPEIIESYNACGVNVGKIVNRIIRYAPRNSLLGLNAIKILYDDPSGKGFAFYSSERAEIRLFVSPLICWLPWILKKSFIFPYFLIGLTLGHELDHHVNRDKKDDIDMEASADNNALKYVYPSFGIFKPLVKILYILMKKITRKKRGMSNEGPGLP